MPATLARLVEAKVSVDQVDLLCTAVQPGIEDLFARDETMLLDDVIGPLRVPDAVRMVDYWKHAAFDSVGQEAPVPNPDSRHLSAVRTFNGTVDLRGNLDVLGGTELLEELASIEQELFDADWAAARAEHGPDALPSHLPRTAVQGQYRQPRPLLTVHVGLGTLSRMCELADGTIVTPHQVFPTLTAADIERIVFDSPSRVLDVGVRQRFFTGALRRAIEVRDRHCQDPSGCDEPAHRCHIDHNIRYTDGGLTTQDNGRCMCPTHNRQREQQRQRNQRPPPDDTS
jgi:hypothetical protein